MKERPTFSFLVRNESQHAVYPTSTFLKGGRKQNERAVSMAIARVRRIGRGDSMGGANAAHCSELIG